MLATMYHPKELNRQISEGNIQYLLISILAKPQGFCAYQILNEQALKVHKLYILPRAQGKGLGASLLAWVTNTYPNKTMNLNVNKYNLNAINFYKKMGFSIVGQEVIPLEHGFVMDDYIMQKSQ
jgi:diamine N-acetyltransferase